jgi:hypothetical protein
VAESGMILPATGAFGIGVWLLAGLVAQQWWVQFGCMALAVYLMVELSNSNALLRVRSRMVTSTFIVLTSTAPFLFQSVEGGVVTLCFVAVLLFLFRSYQDPQASGSAYYAFLFMGLSSLLYIHMLFYVPLLWLLMMVQLQSLSWRTWIASLIGLATPFWIGLPWLLYSRNYEILSTWLGQLGSFPFPYDYSSLSFGQVSVFVFTGVLTLVGIVHFQNRAFEDRIRIRMLYGFFIIVNLVTVAFVAMQPQHYDVLMRIILITGSPLVAHFFTLTNMRLTNIFFVVSCLLAVVLTMLNLYTPLIVSTGRAAVCLWNGLLNF